MNTSHAALARLTDGELTRAYQRQRYAALHTDTAEATVLAAIEDEMERRNLPMPATTMDRRF